MIFVHFIERLRGSAHALHEVQHSSKGIAFLFTLLQYERSNLNIITQHNCKKLIYIHMHACTEETFKYFYQLFSN